MIKTYQGTIYPWNCDHMDHMNVMFYVEKFDEATWNLLASYGLSSKYLKEVFAGDNIYIFSKIIEVKGKIIRFRHEMYNLESNEKVAETELVGLHIDTEKRKGVVIPEFINLKLKNLNEVKSALQQQT